MKTEADMNEYLDRLTVETKRALGMTTRCEALQFGSWVDNDGIGWCWPRWQPVDHSKPIIPWREWVCDDCHSSDLRERCRPIVEEVCFHDEGHMVATASDIE